MYQYELAPGRDFAVGNIPRGKRKGRIRYRLLSYLLSPMQKVKATPVTIDGFCDPRNRDQQHKPWKWQPT